MSNQDLELSSYEYNLPKELIADRPAKNRQDSRMLAFDMETGECELNEFKNFIDFLKPGDALVLNDTKVIPARLHGKKKETGGKVEALLLEELGLGKWQAMLKRGARIPPNSEIIFDDYPNAGFVVTAKNDDGTYEIDFSNHNVEDILANIGQIPLPPYMQRDADSADTERYQTVFADTAGAVAAPTAGLHFTDDVLADIAKKEIQICKLTLHVGMGTFQPVKVDNLEDHKMHSERYSLSAKTAKTLCEVRKNGGRIIAVGTTVVRVLESCFDEKEFLRPGSGRTEIFLYPPYKPKTVDALLTNFHLPASTLLMLISTFSSREKILKAYEFAVQEKFRFYSYGDCMLIL